MPETWQIRVYDQQQSVCVAEVSGRVELGRQYDGSERLYSKKFSEEDKLWRIVIAGRDEAIVSRHHALLEPEANGQARLSNKSTKVPIVLPDGSNLNAGESCCLTLPAEVTLGRKVVRVSLAQVAAVQFQGLPESMAPGMTMATPSAYSSYSLIGLSEDIRPESIIEWIKAAMGVLQSAAASDPEFFQKAARAVVENVGLDSCRILLRKDHDWETVATSTDVGVDAGLNINPSRSLLTRVFQERRTLYPNSAQMAEVDSLAGISAVVVSPILSPSGECIGVLYGDRRKARVIGQAPRISRLDAMLVELLASGVSAGLARAESERLATAARVQFEQFFTPELARQIALRPELLEGQDSEITVLFCDIRGFSRISEHLGPAKTVRWINTVMGVLSDCVLAHRGVLVDYIGDELMAMWGAPEEQPDHPTLACRAALEMIDLLPKLNEQWLQELGEPLDLGIGINTGIARVGNTGSYRKFKYGPLGNTVNLASRVQGVTKYVKVHLLVTQTTRERIGQEFAVRRIGKVRVVNIAEPVNLFEISTPGSSEWEEISLQYESALEEFERKSFRTATHNLCGLLTKNPDDGPSMVLLSRVVQGRSDPESFDPVFVVPGK